MKKDSKCGIDADLKREVWLAELWTSCGLYKKLTLIDLFTDKELNHSTFEMIEQLLAEHIFLGGFNHE